jgi:Cellulose biosynthesis protein BcsS
MAGAVRGSARSGALGLTSHRERHPDSGSRTHNRHLRKRRCRALRVLSLGAKRALGGPLDRDGFVVMGGAGIGGAPEERRWSFDRLSFHPSAKAYALAGYQWMLGPAAVSVLAGPELDTEMEAGASLRSARTRFGLRGHAELWAHPTPETLVTGTLIAGSARGHVWSRASAGYALRPGIFVGPEASVHAEEDYREWRVGAHVTGLRWGPLNLRLSGGFMQTTDERPGAYVGVSGYIRM